VGADKLATNQGIPARMAGIKRSHSEFEDYLSQSSPTPSLGTGDGLAELYRGGWGLDQGSQYNYQHYKLDNRTLAIELGEGQDATPHGEKWQRGDGLIELSDLVNEPDNFATCWKQEGVPEPEAPKSKRVCRNRRSEGQKTAGAAGEKVTKIFSPKEHSSISTPQSAEATGGDDPEQRAERMVRLVRNAMPQVDAAQMDAWITYLWTEYGLVGQVKRDAVTKIILMNRLLLELHRAGLVQLVPLDEVERAGRFCRALRKHRRFDMPSEQCLAFNLAFRVLQATHEAWPARGRDAKGTKGMTQALSAVGLGPPRKGQHKRKAEGQRGPEETDPQMEFDEKTGKYTVIASKRDGLYFREYEYCAARQDQNKRHLFCRGL